MTPLAEWLARTPSAPWGKLASLSGPAACDLPPDIALVQAPDLDVSSIVAEREQELRALFAAELDQQRQHFTSDLAKQRHTLAVEQARTLTSVISGAFESLRSQLAEAVAGALAPVLATAVAARAHTEFVRAVISRLDDGELMRVEIKAPDHIAAELREQLKNCSAPVQVEAAEGIEAWALCNGVTIETRIDDWLRAAGLRAP